MKPTRRLRNLLLGSTLLATITTAHAADYTWDGETDGNWGTATNWDATPTFDENTNLIFSGTPVTTTTFLGNNRIVGSITFDLLISAISVNLENATSAGRTLTLGSATVAPTITVNDSASNAAALIHVIGNTARGSVILANNLTVDVDGPFTGQTVTQLQIARPIGGDFGITKSGTGLLYLNATNTYTGKTVVNGGRLRIKDADSLGANPASFVADQLTLNGGSLYFGTDTTFGNRGITLGAGGGGFIGGPTKLIDVAITGPGGLTQEFFTGGYTLTLSGNNSYAGGTTITNVGTLVIGHANALGSSSGSLTMGGTSKLQLNGFNQSIGNLTGAAGTIIENGAAGTNTLTIGNGDTGGGNFQGTLQNGAAGTLALTKTGAGTITLSGTNTYTGDTTIEKGLLTLAAANPSNESSTVTIAATDATLDMTYAGTDTVDKLFFGTTQQPLGIYSASSVPAGATIPTDRFTGTGTLTVTSGPPAGGFSSWITGTFTNGTVTNQGANDDDDNDGISNLVEYAIAGEDPTVPKASIGSFDGTTLSFTKRAGTTGLTYAIQESTDLGIGDDWTEVAGGTYTNDGSTISYAFPGGGPAKNFLRLQVTSN